MEIPILKNSVYTLNRDYRLKFCTQLAENECLVTENLLQ